MNMRVCRLSHGSYSKDRLSGLASHWYPLSMELKKLGVEQTIITNSSETDNIDGIQIHNLKPESPFSLIRSGLTACKAINKLGDFDIVHFHNPGYGLITAKRKVLPPLVMTLHSSPFNLGINWDLRSVKEKLYFYHLTKFASPRVDALVSVSSGVREELLLKFGLDSKKVHTITTGVNPEKFYPSDVDRDIDILFVGRFSPVKRILDLIKAIDVLKEQNFKLNVYFIGGQPSDVGYGNILTELKKRSLTKNIKLVKPLSQDKLRNYYQRAKMLVLPSIVESSPKVTIEAMACETPVITTNVPGNKDTMVDGRTGFLVNMRDPKDLANKIQLLLEDEELRRETGKFASTRVLKSFTWDIIARKYFEIYQTLSK